MNLRIWPVLWRMSVKRSSGSAGPWRTPGAHTSRPGCSPTCWYRPRLLHRRGTGRGAAGVPGAVLLAPSPKATDLEVVLAKGLHTCMMACRLVLPDAGTRPSASGGGGPCIRDMPGRRWRTCSPTRCGKRCGCSTVVSAAFGSCLCVGYEGYRAWQEWERELPRRREGRRGRGIEREVARGLRRGPAGAAHTDRIPGTPAATRAGQAGIHLPDPVGTRWLVRRVVPRGGACSRRRVARPSQASDASAPLSRQRRFQRSIARNTSSRSRPMSVSS